MRELTKEQIKILETLQAIDVCIMEEGLDETIEDILDEFDWMEVKIDNEKADEELDVLEHYGYIKADRTLTCDGEQYLKLYNDGFFDGVINIGNVNITNQKHETNNYNAPLSTVGFNPEVTGVKVTGMEVNNENSIKCSNVLEKVKRFLKR